jgi:hypothetical protein
VPIYYRVDIGQQFPEQRANPDVPHWEAFVEIPDNVRKTVKGSLQWHAMETALTAIDRLRSVNDPLFKPHSRLAQRVDFDVTREAYPELDLRFPEFITSGECPRMVPEKTHSELP